VRPKRAVVPEQKEQEHEEDRGRQSGAHGLAVQPSMARGAEDLRRPQEEQEEEEEGEEERRRRRIRRRRSQAPPAAAGSGTSCLA